MRRTIQLSSLTVGRCFTVPGTDGADGAAPAESGAAGPGGESSAVMGRAVMKADNVWKVTGAGDPMTAQNATGDSRDFAASTAVVEIPRQGYDRMVERAG